MFKISLKSMLALFLFLSIPVVALAAESNDTGNGDAVSSLTYSPFVIVAFVTLIGFIYLMLRD